MFGAETLVSVFSTFALGLFVGYCVSVLAR